MRKGITMDELNEQKERAAAEAWERIKSGHHWSDWRVIAEGLEVGRDKALHETNSNKPFGRAYTTAFKAWLDQRPWARELANPTRAHLFWYVDHAAAVETWRDTLASNQRMAWTHPTTVKRKFEQMTAIKNPEKSEKLSSAAKQKLEIIRLQEENDQLKKRADGGSLFDLKRDRPEDIVRVIIDTVSNGKLKQIIKLLTEGYKNKYSAHAG